MSQNIGNIITKFRKISESYKEYEEVQFTLSLVAHVIVSWLTLFKEGLTLSITKEVSQLSSTNTQSWQVPIYCE